MTTPIPLRLAQRKRELEDLIATHKASARSAGDLLAGINEAIQAYEEEAAERVPAETTERPGPTSQSERTRAPRRDIRGMVLEFLGTGLHAGQYTVGQIAEALELRPQQVRDALEHLHSVGKVETVAGPDGPWRAIPAAQTTTLASEAADHIPVDDGPGIMREPSLPAQDAA